MADRTDSPDLAPLRIRTAGPRLERQKKHLRILFYAFYKVQKVPKAKFAPLRFSGSILASKSTRE